MSEPEISRDGDVTFSVRQVHFDGSFTHWEAELTVKGQVYCEATGPTFWQVMDCLTEYVFDETVKMDLPALDHNWFKMDSNDRS